MRFLLTTVPGTSHLLPLVPLAHAALAAGHDVLVASGGPAVPAAVSAGLHAVAVDGGESARLYQDMARRVTETSIATEWSDAELVAYFAGVFADIGAVTADNLVATARQWGADAIVYPPPHVVGLVAARALGVPAVLHGLGTRRPTFGPALAHLAPLAEKLGVTQLPEAEVEIDLSLASLPTIHQDRPGASRAAHALPMRYSPYNGGAVLPRWLLRPADRPRVVVTLGSIPLIYRDGGLLRDVIEAAAGLDVELVVTTGGAELPALPDPLPAHVRLVEWIPLSALLTTADAIVHHGGMGTMYAAFDAGVPQLAIPTDGTDSTANAKVVAASGGGLLLDGQEASATAVAAALDNLLHTASFRQASRALAAEIREMPAPATVIGQLTGLLEDRS